MPRIKHKSQHLGAFTSNGVKCLNPVIITHIQKTPFFILSKLPNKLFFTILEWIAIQKSSRIQFRLWSKNTLEN